MLDPRSWKLLSPKPLLRLAHEKKEKWAIYIILAAYKSWNLCQWVGVHVIRLITI